MTMQPGAIASEFPAWQVSIRPGGLDICTAFWCSQDGRARRYVVARSSTELIARLRAISEEDATEQQQPPSQARPRNRVPDDPQDHRAAAADAG